MSEITVKKLSEIIGAPVETLLQQMQDAGIHVKGSDDNITDRQKLDLLEHMRQRSGSTEDTTAKSGKITLKKRSSDDLKLSGSAGKGSRTVNVEVRRKNSILRRNSQDQSLASGVSPGSEETATSSISNRAEELSKALEAERQARIQAALDHREKDNVSYKKNIISNTNTTAVVTESFNDTENVEKFVKHVEADNQTDDVSLDEDVLDDDKVLTDDSDTEEYDGYEDGSIYPYDMPEEVDVREDSQTVFEWMRKLDREVIISNPEFQRKLVWKPKQKSLFIESVLLNIPLPPLYVNQRKDGKYILVDGLQRTTTLHEFMNNKFLLSNLRVLTKLNDKKFSELTEELQTKVEDKKLFVYVMKPSVPLNMVYDIFHRINTGGTQLTRQEIRNCFFIGQATEILKELAGSSEFRLAIDNGISSTRMKDREAVLRCLAFRVLDYKTEYKNDMDAFLGKAMECLNKMNPVDIQRYKEEFKCAMEVTYEFFDKENFRLPTESTRGRINIALIESISYFFAENTRDFLHKNKQKILENYEELLKHSEYVDAVRVSTGDTRRVNARFDLATKILGNK